MTEREWLMEVLQGCEPAVQFCLDLADVSQVWDDLIDEGRSDAVNQAFIAALVAIPANPFYRAHFEALHPMVAMWCLDYVASLTLEAGSTHDRTIAFAIRDSYAALVQQCALLIGGIGYAASQAARIRRGVHDEPLAEYLGGLTT